MSQPTATVEMDERGRVVIPKGVRRSLGVDGDEAILTLTVERMEGCDE